MLGYVGVVLELSWTILGPSWAILLLSGAISSCLEDDGSIPKGSFFLLYRFPIGLLRLFLRPALFGVLSSFPLPALLMIERFGRVA